MKLETTIYDNISAMNPLEWDEIVAEGNIFQTHSALTFFEKNALLGWPPTYFVFRDQDGHIAAHATAFRIPTDLLIFAQGPVKNLVNRIRKTFPAFLNPCILECGCPISP